MQDGTGQPLAEVLVFADDGQSARTSSTGEFDLRVDEQVTSRRLSFAAEGFVIRSLEVDAGVFVEVEMEALASTPPEPVDTTLKIQLPAIESDYVLYLHSSAGGIFPLLKEGVLDEVEVTVPLPAGEQTLSAVGQGAADSASAKPLRVNIQPGGPVVELQITETPATPATWNISGSPAQSGSLLVRCGPEDESVLALYVPELQSGENQFKVHGDGRCTAWLIDRGPDGAAAHPLVVQSTDESVNLAWPPAPIWSYDLEALPALAWNVPGPIASYDVRVEAQSGVWAWSVSTIETVYTLPGLPGAWQSKISSDDEIRVRVVARYATDEGQPAGWATSGWLELGASDLWPVARK